MKLKHSRMYYVLGLCLLGILAPVAISVMAEPAALGRWSYGSRRSSAARRALLVSLPRSTRRAVERTTCAMASTTLVRSMSYRPTSKPAHAPTWAMPRPIVPAPMTKRRRNDCGPSICSDVTMLPSRLGRSRLRGLGSGLGPCARP